MSEIEKLRTLLHKEAVDYTVCTDGNVLQVKEDDRFYLRTYQAEHGIRIESSIGYRKMKEYSAEYVLRVILQYFEWTRKLPDKTSGSR